MRRSLIPRPLHLATISLGSNVGDRLAYLDGALRRLLEDRRNRLRKLSSLYETEPYGVTDQPWFFNRIIQVETPLEARGFFRCLQKIEASFRRVRTRKWGPRTLDLDLLFFDDLVIDEPDLKIPHPGVPHRRFVLEPLCEIAPGLIHPVLGRTVGDLLASLQDSSRVIRRPEKPDPEESC